MKLLPANFGILVIVACSLLLVIIGCKEQNSAPIQPTPFTLEVPSHFPNPIYQTERNPFTREGFLLGKKIFHDTRLSRTQTISCASCHRQLHAFADGNQSVSTGIEGKTGKRNAPAIFNMAWNPYFMWDGGVNHIEVMPLAPLLNDTEMGETVVSILQKLRSDTSYVRMFNDAFHRDTIDDQQFFYALAQYMSHIISADSRYDQYIRKEIDFSASEQRGLLLFRQHCASCHTEPLFTDYSLRNNGLYLVYPDSGHYRVSRKPGDIGKFKVPTLRNIAVTDPYMHDGSIASLEDVIAHYTQNIKPHPNLDSLLKQGGKIGFSLTQDEKDDLMNFLLTLTDSNLLKNPVF